MGSETLENTQHAAENKNSILPLVANVAHI